MSMIVSKRIERNRSPTRSLLWQTRIGHTNHTYTVNGLDAYHAENRRSIAQRLRRLWEWAKEQVKTAWVLEQVKKLCGRSWEYGRAYEHVGGHGTSNMLDRVMRGMNRYFDAGQHWHGDVGAVERHVRAWALLSNFRPWNPATARANNGWRSPAERVNRLDHPG